MDDKKDKVEDEFENEFDNDEDDLEVNDDESEVKSFEVKKPRKSKDDMITKGGTNSFDEMLKPYKTNKHYKY